MSLMVTEVGLGPGHIVLGWNPVPPRPGAQQPSTVEGSTLRPMSVVAKRLDGSGTTWYSEVGLGPSDIGLDGDPGPPPKGALQPPRKEAQQHPLPRFLADIALARSLIGICWVLVLFCKLCRAF